LGSGTKRRNIPSLQSRKASLSGGGGLELKCPPGGSIEVDGSSNLIGLSGKLAIEHSALVFVTDTLPPQPLNTEESARIIECLRAGISYEASIRQEGSSVLIDFHRT
jgi:hypothetical protein